jgi:ElaB/YqjD/DUF883 family membrane-anchored ribosome-binding protein
MTRSTESSGVLETAAATAASVASELSATLDSAAELARAAANLADQRVRQRPWETALIAAGVGFLIGLCVRGR